jgi:hypothetical protein
MQGVGFDPDRLKVRSIGSSERTVHLTFREVSPSSKEDWLRRGTQGGAREEAIETWLDDRDCPAGRLVRYKLVARWRDLARLAPPREHLCHQCREFPKYRRAHRRGEPIRPVHQCEERS